MTARRGPLGALAAFLLLVGGTAVPAHSQGSRLGLSVAPVRVEFFAESPAPKPVAIYVKGDVAGTVQISMLDVVPGDDGRWQRVAYGTTSATLEGYLDISPASFTYLPDGTEQRFTTTLTIDPGAADDVRYGSLIATLVPAERPPEGASQVLAAVAIQVLTAQAAAEIPAADLRLALDALDLRARAPWTVLDRFIPDIPSVIGHGPAIMSASGRNIGEYFVDEVTVFEVRRVSPLALLPFIDAGEPRPILRVSMTPRYTLPGQSFTDETTTLIPLDGGGEVDALPFIGFVKVTARATGSLGGIEAAEAVRSKTVLVFPWSEGLFALLIWVFSRGRRRRGHAVTPRAGFRQRVREVRGRGKESGSGFDPEQPTLF